MSTAVRQPNTCYLQMSLCIGLADNLTGQPSSHGPIVTFDGDENGGYYSFLYPFFEALAQQTGQLIDLYGDAKFWGDDLQLLRLTILEARQLVVAQPERWSVYTGTITMPNAPEPPPPRVVFKEVERSKLLALLDSFSGIVDRSVETGVPVVCFGD